MHKDLRGAEPGSSKGLPKYTPAAVTRSAKAECLPYQDLEKAYSKTDEDLHKAVNTHSQAFQEVHTTPVTVQFTSYKKLNFVLE